MKRLLLIALGIALVSFQSATAHTRHVDGTVLLPAPKALSAVQANDAAARCAWLAAGSSSQGVLGWVVPLTIEDEDHRFSLSGALDPDVSFYTDLGACDGTATVRLGSFTGPSWEAGRIPAGARHAVITIAPNSTGRSFTFGIF